MRSASGEKRDATSRVDSAAPRTRMLRRARKATRIMSLSLGLVAMRCRKPSLEIATTSPASTTRAERLEQRKVRRLEDGKRSEVVNHEWKLMHAGDIPFDTSLLR